MGIVLYRGARGQSKSLSMTKDALKYMKNGWKVYTNLEGTPFINIDSDFILELSGDSKLFNCVLVIDEIELFFDSRDWNKKEAKRFSRFLQQIRKRNVHILCTAQFTNLIDIRLRQQIDTLVICSYDKESMISRCLYIDLTSLESNLLKPDAFEIVYKAEPIFSCYDTHHLIN